MGGAVPTSSPTGKKAVGSAAVHWHRWLWHGTATAAGAARGQQHAGRVNWHSDSLGVVSELHLCVSSMYKPRVGLRAEG